MHSIPSAGISSFRSFIRTATRALLASLLFAAAAAIAATKYVSPSGSDTANTGDSTSSPYRTIAKGLSMIGSGGTLYIMAGTYDELLFNNIPSGSASIATLIRNYNTDVVTIRPTTGTGVVYLHNGADKITFKGIIFDANGRGGNPIQLGTNDTDGPWTNATNIRMEDCTVKNGTGASGGIVTMPGSNNCVFLRLKVHDNGDDPTQDHGFYIRSSGNTIEGCEIFRNAAHGIHVFSSSGTGTSSNNVIKGNFIYNNALVSTSFSPGIGIYTGTGNKVFNNICWNNGVGINVALSATNTEVYNNTTYANNKNSGSNAGGFGVRIKFTAGTGTIVRNNIGFSHTTNDYSEEVAATDGNNLFGTNPQFVNATPTVADHFKLQGTSPAINQGTNVSPINTLVTTDYWGEARPAGSAYDIGADEYVSSVPAAPSNVTTSNVAYNSIQVNWADNSSNETGFKIERKKGSGGTFVQVGTAGAGAVSFTDTTVGPNRQYFFRVRAYNGSGDSAYSAESAATTTPELTSGLRAYWKLNETSGTTTADASGNGNTGTLSGGPTWTTSGLVNGALSFDGVDDSVNAGSGTTLDDLVAQGSGGMTASAFINAVNMGEGGFGRIVVKAAGTTPTSGWQLLVGGTNQVTFASDFTGTSSVDLVRQTATNSIGTGSWYHVVVTWTGSATATTAKIYVNKVEASYAVSTNGAGTRASDASSNLYLGNESGGTRTFNGVLDEIRLFNRVLSSAEITALYNANMLSY